MRPNEWIQINEIRLFLSDPSYTLDLKSDIIDRLNNLNEIVRINGLDNKAGHITTFINYKILKIKFVSDLGKIIKEAKEIASILFNHLNNFTV